ncbi:MAG: hypothetical protein HOE90_08405 [Bacteriovoracaceae bacterium]|jgi:hypothetical protein|nr:hypothetical protein [Bacteriovoracaceae bacterium]
MTSEIYTKNITKSSRHPFNLTITITILASIFFHTFVVLLLNFLAPYINFDANRSLVDRSIVIEKAPVSILKKYRTKGVEDGMLDSVSINPSSSSPGQKSRPHKKVKAAGKKTNFSSLKLNFNSMDRGKILIAPGRPKSLKDLVNADLPYITKDDKLKARFFSKSNLQIMLVPPKGIPEDQLNKSELIFYGFRKRIEQSYISSIYTAYDDFILKNPRFVFTPSEGKEEKLVAKISYDKNGNIRVLKIISASENLKIQRFFENVMKGVGYLPNPPTSLTKEEDEFTIYYNLIINS